MKIASVSSSSQSISSVNQKTQDNFEKDIRQQITRLQDKMKSLDSDKEMTAEQKLKEKQSIQEQIKDLNSELKQHQLEKQQEEDAKKQEEAKKAAESNTESTEREIKTGLGNAEAGVMISLSATDEQIDSIRKIRTNLEGKLRTAETEEEKKNLQDKLGNVSKYMGKSIKKSVDVITDYRKSEKDEDGTVKKRADFDKKVDKNIVPQENRNNSFWIQTAENENRKVSIQ